MAYRFTTCFAVSSHGPLKQMVLCGCKHVPLSRTRSDGQMLIRKAYSGYNVSRHTRLLSSHFMGQGTKWQCSAVQYKVHYMKCPSPRTDLRLYQDTFFIRPFHSTTTLWQKEAEEEKTAKKGKNVDTKTQETTSVVVEKKTVMVFVKKGWNALVHFLQQFWNGFKLLCIDVKVSAGLVLKVLRGKTLTRREYRQLVRTTADLFRLVPFLVFVIVPFMEFLLPVALKLFPNMLPSTFTNESSEKEKLKKSLKAKLEMAKFLQETLKESAPKGARKGVKSSVEEFSEFMNKIRSEGTQATTEEILKYSKLFENELTLENLTRAQIQALCVVLGVSRMGPEAVLRMRLSVKLQELFRDDKMIQKEGIDGLAVWELQDACRARGMRALGVPADRLKSQLQQWIDLHVTEKVPASLLLLSRAMYLPETLSTTEQLQATLSALPQNTEVEAKIKIAETRGESVDNKTRIEHIKQKDKEIKQEQQELAVKEAAEALEAQEVKEKLVDVAEPIIAKPSEEFPAEKAAEEEITTEDLQTIETALEEIAEEKDINIVAEELKDLREDMEEYEEDMKELRDVVVRYEDDVKLEESKAAKRLAKRVNRLLEQSDNIIKNLHKEKAQILEEIEVKEIRIKRNPELTEDQMKRDKMIQQISEEKGNLISINEVVLGLKRLQKIPDETRLQGILEVLDEDHDGNIDVTHVLKVIEVLSRENLKFSPAQVTEVVDLLKKEEIMLGEMKLKEKEEKELEIDQSANSKKEEQKGLKNKEEEVVGTVVEETAKQEKKEKQL